MSLPFQLIFSDRLETVVMVYNVYWFSSHNPLPWQPIDTMLQTHQIQNLTNRFSNVFLLEYWTYSRKAFLDLVLSFCFFFQDLFSSHQNLNETSRRGYFRNWTSKHGYFRNNMQNACIVLHPEACIFGLKNDDAFGTTDTILRGKLILSQSLLIYKWCQWGQMRLFLVMLISRIWEH